MHKNSLRAENWSIWRCGAKTNRGFTAASTPLNGWYCLGAERFTYTGTNDIFLLHAFANLTTVMANMNPRLQVFKTNSEPAMDKHNILCILSLSQKLTQVTTSRHSVCSITKYFTILLLSYSQTCTWGPRCIPLIIDWAYNFRLQIDRLHIFRPP